MLTPMTDEEHDYTCLLQVDVFLRKPDKAAPFAERCHRAIPYPLVVILHDGESLMLSMAEKRYSRDGKEQTVLERTVRTDWLPSAALDEFRCAADFPHSRKTSFYVQRILEYLCRKGHANRQEISQLIKKHLSHQLTDSQKERRIGNLLSVKMSSRMKVIINRGSRSCPSWELTDAGRKACKKGNPSCKKDCKIGE